MYIKQSKNKKQSFSTFRLLSFSRNTRKEKFLEKDRSRNFANDCFLFFDYLM